MKMTLGNFCDFVPSRIWWRGEEYYSSGAIISIEESLSGEWRAVVEGTYDYNVRIVTDGDEILEWECDCPYDGGDICKHVVAVVMAIRNIKTDDSENGLLKKPRSINGAKAAKWSETVTGISEPRENLTFTELLSNASADELRRVIMEYSLKNDGIKNCLIDFFKRNAVREEGMVNYVEQVREIFSNAYSVNGHRSRYREPDWGDICFGMDAIFEEAECMLKKGNVHEVWMVVMAFFEGLADIADAECSYEVNDLCGRAGELLIEALRTGEIDCKMALSKLEDVTKSLAYEEYGLYEVDELLARVRGFALSPEEALEYLETLLASRRTPYELDCYVLQKVELLRRLGRDSEAEDTMDRYICLEAVREMRLEELLDAERFDDALKLADDGIALAGREMFSDSAVKWMEKKLEIFERLGDVESSIDVCRCLFIVERGSMEYYYRLKKMVAASGFSSFLQDMISKTSSSTYGGHSVIADIYLQENDYDSLFSFLASAESHRLDLLKNYAHRLPSSYAKDLLALFVEDLRLYAKKNVGRNHYIYLARIMSDMKKLSGGAEISSVLAEEFRHTYRRRPLMLDELRGI